MAKFANSPQNNDAISRADGVPRKARPLSLNPQPQPFQIRPVILVILPIPPPELLNEIVHYHRFGLPHLVP